MNSPIEHGSGEMKHGSDELNIHGSGWPHSQDSFTLGGLGVRTDVWGRGLNIRGGGVKTLVVLVSLRSFSDGVQVSNPVSVEFAFPLCCGYI